MGAKKKNELKNLNLLPAGFFKKSSILISSPSLSSDIFFPLYDIIMSTNQPKSNKYERNSILKKYYGLSPPIATEKTNPLDIGI